MRNWKCKCIQLNTLRYCLSGLQGSKQAPSSVYCKAVTKSCTSHETYSRAVCEADFLVKKNWRKIFEDKLDFS